MAWLNSFGHVLGAIIGLIVLAVFTGWVHRMVNAGMESSGKAKASKLTGIPITDLENTDHKDTLNSYIIKRSDPKLLANRISDLCGTLLSVFLLFSAFAQVFFIVLGTYFSIRQSELAPVAWAAVAMAVATWIISLMLTFLCRMLTGRAPGQARVMRRTLALEAERNARLAQHTQNH